MPLTEQHRQKLDGIVQQMIANKEPDENVRAVVDDFKRKYDQPAPQAPAQQAGMGQTLSDFVSGARAGLASTLMNARDLLAPERSFDVGGRKFTAGGGLLPPTQSPAGQALASAPDTLPAKVGRFAEGVAEFAVPLSKISKASAGLSLGKRLGVEAFTGGQVAALQSGGDPFAVGMGATLGALVPAAGAGLGAAGRAIKRTAEGAQEGGFGGAVAGLVRNVTELDPVDAMMRAIKPRNTRIEFGSALRESLPELKASEAALGKPIETIEDLLAATKDAKKRLWKAREEILGPAREMGSQVDGNDIADAIERSIPKRTAQMDPGKAESIVRGAQTYRKKLSLDEAEKLLREVNDELEAYYNKLPPGRAKSESDPAIAPILAEAKALRATIEKTLGAEGQGAGARELARRYGKLMEIEDAAYRRVNVANRQQPESLSEQMGNWSAAGDIARGAWALSRGDIRGMADVAAGTAKREAAKFAKEQQTTNALIRRSMATVKSKPAPYPKYTPPKVAGLLEAGPRQMPPAPDPSGVRSVPAKREGNAFLGVPEGTPDAPRMFIKGRLEIDGYSAEVRPGKFMGRQGYDVFQQEPGGGVSIGWHPTEEGAKEMGAQFVEKGSTFIRNSPQYQYLSEIGMTMKQAVMLSPKKKAQLNSNFQKWLKAKGATQ